jgi:hypothetical protein
VIEGKLEGRIEMTGRRGRRRKQLLDDLKETRGYWALKEEALDRTLWRTRFGRHYGPTEYRMDDSCVESNPLFSEFKGSVISLVSFFKMFYVLLYFLPFHISLFLLNIFYFIETYVLSIAVIEKDDLATQGLPLV